MSKDLLTQRLVTTRHFAPGGSRDDRSGPTEPAEMESAEPLVRVEEDAMREQSVIAAWSEVRRRRGEVLDEIDGALAALEKRREKTEELLRTLAHRRDAIASIRVDQRATPGLAELRRMKQDLQDAHVELTLFQRQDSAGGVTSPSLAEMSVGELSRLGWAVLWPVVVGLVAAAAIVAVGVRLALTL